MFLTAPHEAFINLGIYVDLQAIFNFLCVKLSVNIDEIIFPKYRNAELAISTMPNCVQFLSVPSSFVRRWKYNKLHVDFLMDPFTTH